MAYTDINSEDRLVQQTFADHLRERLGWESVYALNDETFGPDGTLGRAGARRGADARSARGAGAAESGPAASRRVDEAVAEADAASISPAR